MDHWRSCLDFRLAQKAGRERLFKGYRIRVARIIRDCSEPRRTQAPEESQQVFS